jgi:hypothetical protein
MKAEPLKHGRQDTRNRHPAGALGRQKLSLAVVLLAAYEPVGFPPRSRGVLDELPEPA